MERLKIFITGFLQVAFVGANTYFITNLMWPYILITSFLISFIWTLNVKKVAFGDWYDRIIYATGAMFGCGTGVYIAGLM